MNQALGKLFALYDKKEGWPETSGKPNEDGPITIVAA